MAFDLWGCGCAVSNGPASSKRQIKLKTKKAPRASWRSGDSGRSTPLAAGCVDVWPPCAREPLQTGAGARRSALGAAPRGPPCRSQPGPHRLSLSPADACRRGACWSRWVRRGYGSLVPALPPPPRSPVPTATPSLRTVATAEWLAGDLRRASPRPLWLAPLAPTPRAGVTVLRAPGRRRTNKCGGSVLLG
ncbi:hypothetical protein BS78_06G161400 [Paspalum vaginatum]|nr:hypothetical protein BS78_06G161400 [Paspalum vaginatum]